MTTQKHLKRRVRERMAVTGERYAAARRHVAGSPAPAAADPIPRAIHPETAALRSALAGLGATAPHTGRPWSEEMLLGLGGGVGIGVFAFQYAAEDFSSFYLGARHLWDDSPAFLRAAAARVGAAAGVEESASARTAARSLADALAAGRAVIASVDMQPLGYRGVPPALSGGGYHVVLVRAVDAAAGRVVVEDLFREPITVDAAAFERARARIRSQKHRIVVLDPPRPDGAPPLERAVRDAMLATAAGLDGTLDPAAGGRRGRNFCLDGLAAWAGRLHGDRSADGWARSFPRGHRLWQGLASVYEYVEHAGTGGGLLRPMYARFLREAGEALGEAAFVGLAQQYDDLGTQWTGLARAALPASEAAFGESARLIARREAAFAEAGPGAIEEIRGIWARLAEIEASMREAFPLAESETEALLAGLQRRVQAIEAGERAAAAALRSAVGTGRGGGT